MRISIRVGLVGALSAMLVLGVSGVAVGQPREVSKAKYAKTLCGIYSDVEKNKADFFDAYNADTSSDPATFQTEVATLSSDLLDNIGQLKTKLKKTYPDVDDGKKISKLFLKNLTEIGDEISSALEAFQAADPDGAAFQADVSKFEVALQLLDTKTSDPFSKLRDQDLLGALDDEKSCKGVVQIIG